MTTEFGNPSGKWNSSAANQRVWISRIRASFVICHSDFIMSLADLRKDYTLAGLRRVEVEADPIHQFQKWFQQASDAQLVEPTAMTLATADSKGRPSAR